MTATTPLSETTLAFRYLFVFRRVVVSLAVLGAVLAWAYEYQALMAAFVCVAIGELLESSYYINVLHWRERESAGAVGWHARQPGDRLENVRHPRSVG